MLRVIKISSKNKDLIKIRKLYECVFPENERGPLTTLLEDNFGCSEIFAFYDKEVFCGFISLLNYKDICHIIYFAVDPVLQGGGYGSQILNLLNDIKPHKRILADVEVKTAIASNNMLRDKRKQFYLRNGFTTTKVAYDWQDDSYEILIRGGLLSEQEFWGFWESICRVNKEFNFFIKTKRDVK